MVKHIIWDLDGTLINSEPEILKHLTRATEVSGIDNKFKIAKFRIGPTLRKVLCNAYSQLSEDQIERVTKEFRESYDNSSFDTTLPFEGIELFFSQLDPKIKHHIVTNKPHYPSKRIIEKLGWENRFISVSSPQRENGSLASKTELMSNILTRFNLKSTEVISIGDMDTDAKAAKENGIYSIGVTWGTGSREELESTCDIVIDEVSELYSTLNFYSNE
ncbi:MAG: HAD family hydrolase [Phocaeicola sp.]